MDTLVTEEATRPIFTTASLATRSRPTSRRRTCYGNHLREKYLRIRISGARRCLMKCLEVTRACGCQLLVIREKSPVF